MLAPFATLAEVARAVPRIVASGVDPTILEYIDVLAMGGITAGRRPRPGHPRRVKAAALAYLVVVLEGMHAGAGWTRTSSDLGTLLGELGALDVYVLPPHAGRRS